MRVDRPVYDTFDGADGHMHRLWTARTGAVLPVRANCSGEKPEPVAQSAPAMSSFFVTGWQFFAPEPAIVEWVRYARLDARRALEDPDLAQWHQCQGTWFVGLDAMRNDSRGRVGGSAPISGAAVEFIKTRCGGWPALHNAQVSAVFPGYPRPRDGETDAAHRYRLNRDAAHVDGVLGLGMPKRRFVKEPHAFILGLPLTEADALAAPLVVWEGSHLIMQRAFEAAFAKVGGQRLDDVDVTDIYQAARKQVFETCARTIVHGPPGSAYLVHRLALHGVAPWADGATAAPEGRIVAYFRPPMQGGARAWAAQP